MAFVRVRTLCLMTLLMGLCFSFVPNVQAQSTALYFPATGHHLMDKFGFLSFWQSHNGADLLGFPVTEVLVVDGQEIQYFERGRLEQHVDAATGVAQVQNGPVGLEYTQALWRQFDPPPADMARDGVQVFGNGHTLRGPFLKFWQEWGGVEFFGPPISEAMWEVTEQGQRRVQYFERGRLERNADMIGTSAEIVVSNLGRALALLRGLDISPIANWGDETFGPPARSAAPDMAVLIPPTPTPVPTAIPVQPTAQPTRAPIAAAPVTRQQPVARQRTVSGQAAPTSSGKSILVNLTKQWLYAFEDGTQVFNAPVATGRNGMETPAGNFSIYAKLKIQTMEGVLDGKKWVVPNVPNVMYINGGVALHGTYWHNLFGTGARPSHGCVNLPLKAAAWLYDWAPMGTPVEVTY